VTAFIYTLCLCAFNFDLNGNTHPRLETCRSTCDDRLQSAALESHVPSSLSPSAADTLFLRREVDSHSTFQGRVEQPSSVGSKTNNLTNKPTQQARPRRLPTLIKILTGFGDEQTSADTNNHKSIIATIEKPDFVPKQTRGTEPLSHEDTVQIAAAAAAAAVFSKSIRIFGHHRMHRVNSEWDAALRWIAGWDQQQQIPSPLDGGHSEPPIRANDGGSLNGGVDNGASQEGYDSFVDDLARMLESCISQCVEDEHFEARLEKDELGPGEVVMGGLSVGNVVLTSVFGWIVASSFPRMSVESLAAMISYDTIVILGRTIQVVGYSMIVYALHNLWILMSPAIFQWYSSLGYTESPEWLLEHEKEIQLAKASSRSRQKKKKRKQATKQLGRRGKAAPSNDGMQKESRVDKRTSVEDELEPDRSARYIESDSDSVKVGGKLSGSQESEQTSASNGGVLHPTAEITVPTSKDSVSGSQDSSESIPSMISYPSTSTSSSPSMKPIGSHLEDQDSPYGAVLQGPPPPVLELNSQLGRQGILSLPLPLPKAFPVPTQEQRNEAAKQLREFQNVQIQRLLLQRKLSQNSNGSRLFTTSPLSSRLISGSSFHSAGTASPVSGQRIKVLRPPPGLSHPSEVRPPPGLTHPSEVRYNPVQQNQDDKAFLTDNELFLSKLLDDDDEDDDVEVPSPSPIGIESMSPESSLDPSAAPFVSSAKVCSTQSVTCPFPKPKDVKADTWQSSPSELLRENSPLRIKGVYGGSVW